MTRRFEPVRSVVAGIVLATLASAANGADFHRYYFKQKRPLQLDVTRIAFQQPPAAAAARPDRARYGIDEATTEVLPVSPWRTARPAKARQSPESIRRTVTQLSADGVVDFVSPVFIGDDGGPVIVTPAILVRFVRSVSKQRAEEILTAHGAGHVLQRDWANMPNAYKLRSTSANGIEVLDTANRLAQLPEVIFAEPDMLFTGRGSLTPDDPHFPQLWGLHNTGQSGGLDDFDMDVLEAWNITTGNASIIVLVLDTGVQQDHPDINQITPGIDTTTDFGDGGPVNACDNHGTAVAGCISARINNSLGVVGACPNCRVASARPFISNLTCDNSWSATGSWTVDALAWGESIGVRVTNNSNGYGFTSAAIASKYDNMRNDGIIHFASAMNDSSPSLGYPSSLASVNAVAASNRFGNRAGFSNWGTGLAFTAPGENIGTTDRTGPAGWAAGDYVYANGTSFASPYSAGVAGLILSADPTLTAVQVEERMQQGAVDLGSAGYDTDYGWGHVNALASLPGGCANDFAAATTSPTGGAGGDRLGRFGCLPAIASAAVAGVPATAVRVTLKTMYNTSAGNPDGANVCPAGRTAPSLSQFDGHTRWLGAPTSAADEATPAPADYIVAPLVCTGAEAELRDWGLDSLAAGFPTTNPTRVFFFGSELVPCSVYEVSHCDDPLDEGTCGDPVLLRTGLLGDDWPPFDPAPGQPSFTDIGAAVNKYKGIPFSPGPTPAGGAPEWHALSRGNVVAGYDLSTVTKVGFLDIGKTVESYKKIPYNEDGPCDPDTGFDSCGNECSTDPD